MDAEDLVQVSDSLRRAVRSGAGGDVRRAVAEFGWHELLEGDAEAAVAILLTLQGELLLPVSFLDDVLVAASGLQPPEGARVVLPRVGGLELTSTLQSSTVLIDGVVQSGPGDVLLVPCRTGIGRVAIAACAAPTPLDAAGTLDPDAGWVALRRSMHVDDLLLDGPDAADAWDRMSSAGRRALAHELVAVGGEMLGLTLRHVTTREQFGRVLGSFQAVKHKLADVRLWQEVAALSVKASWEDGGVASAALAKAAACRFSGAAREHCQQLLGGMGFTWEHSFHRYLRRALTLEPLLGGAAVQHTFLGRALRANTVPSGLAGL